MSAWYETDRRGGATGDASYALEQQSGSREHVAKVADLYANEGPAEPKDGTGEQAHRAREGDRHLFGKGCLHRALIA